MATDAKPKQRGKTASYCETTVFGPGAEVPVWLDGQEIGKISFNDIIP